MGGWFDEGRAQDLRIFPVGGQTFEGVPFRVIDPAANNGAACVVLNTAGNGRYPKGDRPNEVSMPVNRKLTRLVFLVAGAWAIEGDVAAELVVKFAGGEGLFEADTIPLKVGVNLADWFIRGGAVLPRAKLAWSGVDERIPNPIGVWMFEWTNPQPQAEIRTLVFRTGNARTIPALIAVTGESVPAKKQ